MSKPTQDRSERVIALLASLELELDGMRRERDMAAERIAECETIERDLYLFASTHDGTKLPLAIQHRLNRERAGNQKRLDDARRTHHLLDEPALIQTLQRGALEMRTALKARRDTPPDAAATVTYQTDVGRKLAADYLASQGFEPAGETVAEANPYGVLTREGKRFAILYGGAVFSVKTFYNVVTICLREGILLEPTPENLARIEAHRKQFRASGLASQDELDWCDTMLRLTPQRVYPTVPVNLRKSGDGRWHLTQNDAVVSSHASIQGAVDALIDMNVTHVVWSAPFNRRISGVLHDKTTSPERKRLGRLWQRIVHERNS